MHKRPRGHTIVVMFGRRASTPPTPDSALPGRATPLDVADTHFVLGTSIKPPYPADTAQIQFGMGCFWGAERFFWQIPGVHTTAAGYAGGITPNPTYEETCTGRTGHAEAVIVVFRPDEAALDDLFSVFWENHDPTTPNRQGNDVGTQYRSAIYPTTDDQMEAAVASRDRYQKLLDSSGHGTISTEIAPAGPFYLAETYHQQYLAKNPNGYCNHGFCQVAYR
jgi:peptide-methionine (S)-S-oxide reductase